MAEEEHGPTRHHQPDKTGNPEHKGLLSGKNKWYLVGGLALIGILVFVFVKKSNANSTTANGSTTGTTATTGTLDATTESELQSALQAINSGGYGSGSAGTTNNYYSSGSTGSSSTGSAGTSNPGGSDQTSGNGILPLGNPPSGDVWVIGVPNGTGGWMNAVFPTGQAVQNFYQDIGYNNGYPGGLNYNDITGALNQAGATVQSNLTNSKMALSNAGSNSVPHTSR